MTIEMYVKIKKIKIYFKERREFKHYKKMIRNRIIDAKVFGEKNVSWEYLGEEKYYYNKYNSEICRYLKKINCSIEIDESGKYKRIKLTIHFQKRRWLSYDRYDRFSR